MTDINVVLHDGRTVSIDEIGGLTEVAEHYGWNPSTLTTWVNRYGNTPTPVRALGRGALYVITDWDGWRRPGGSEADVDAAAVVA